MDYGTRGDMNAILNRNTKLVMEFLHGEVRIQQICIEPFKKLLKIILKKRLKIAHKILIQCFECSTAYQ